MEGEIWAVAVTICSILLWLRLLKCGSTGINLHTKNVRHLSTSYRHNCSYSQKVDAISSTFTIETFSCILVVRGGQSEGFGTHSSVCVKSLLGCRRAWPNTSLTAAAGEKWCNNLVAMETCCSLASPKIQGRRKVTGWLGHVAAVRHESQPIGEFWETALTGKCYVMKALLKWHTV